MVVVPFRLSRHFGRNKGTVFFIFHFLPHILCRLESHSTYINHCSFLVLLLDHHGRGTQCPEGSPYVTLTRDPFLPWFGLWVSDTRPRVDGGRSTLNVTVVPGLLWPTSGLDVLGSSPTTSVGSRPQVSSSLVPPHSPLSHFVFRWVRFFGRQSLRFGRPLRLQLFRSAVQPISFQLLQAPVYLREKNVR